MTSLTGRKKRRVCERRGFTLVEILVVVVVVGILATIAIPKLQGSRESAHFSKIQQDLRNVGTAQELHFRDHGGYADDPEDLIFHGAEAVTVSVHEVAPSGWAASATHQALAGDEGCALYFGDVEPPELPDGSPHEGGEGTVRCTG